MKKSIHYTIMNPKKREFVNESNFKNSIQFTIALR